MIPSPDPDPTVVAPFRMPGPKKFVEDHVNGRVANLTANPWRFVDWQIVPSAAVLPHRWQQDDPSSA
jgi:hypothetical protein